VKIPLLPETDLARIAPMPTEHKWNALEHYRISFPPYRYLPVRKSYSDILNVQSGFLQSTPRVPFSHVREVVRIESRTAEEFQANLRVAEGLYNHAVAMSLTGRRVDFFPLNIGTGSKLVYWHSLLLAYEGKPLVPFFDPRRTATRLTELGRRFAFSTMHERIRVADPDYANVLLGIFQFTVPKKGPRLPILYTDEGVALFTFDELAEMVRETYEIWTEVYTRRAKTPPKRSGGGFL
jgi:hypothetical protein